MESRDEQGSTPREPREVLGRTSLLAHVSEPVLATLAGRAKRIKLHAGEVFFEEGGPADFVFAVASGLLEALKDSKGKQVAIRRLGPGDLGGLTSLALSRSRSATLRAVTAAELLVIDHSDFRAISRQYTELNDALIANLSGKLRRKNSEIAGLRTRQQSSGYPVAFFDAKPYDRQSFAAQSTDELSFTWIEARLDPYTAELATGHQAVCAFVNDDLSAPTLERLSQLGVRLIALRCAGFNNVDLAAAKALELDVVRVPAYSPHAVAEHALALILTLNRKIHRAHSRVREGNFSLSGLVGFDLHGRTAGVVGLGKIGQCCASILRGFGMRVLAQDLAPDVGFAEANGVLLVDLQTLLRESDVVTLHAPLVLETRHMIDTESIKLMKRGVMLINTSRGALVDAAALIKGLKSGHIGSAGLDVYEEESEYFFEDRSERTIDDDVLARLMTFNNVLITSHQAFLTVEALANIASTTVASLREVLAGRTGAELSYAVPPE